MFGPRVLGEEGAKQAAQRATNDMGGGAIQFGPRVLGASAAVATAPKPATASRNRLSPAQRAKPAKKGKADAGQGAFSEAEVEKLLTDDPNLWERVVEAESRRTIVRPAVARMVLAIRDVATDPALTTAVIALLEAVVTPKVAAPRAPKGLPARKTA